MRTRFAPSPTGPLHLGHAFSAMTAYDMAKAADGAFLLRIEDTDTSRARAEWETQIYEDLTWLGLDWPTPVLRQSDTTAAYDAALAQLRDKGLIFACTCNRADIRAALSAPQEGAQTFGPDGLVYPGTCREAGHEFGDDVALRLNMTAACAALPQTLTYRELELGTVTVETDLLPKTVGDVVLQRRDTGMPAYHLAAVVDDAIQGVTHVIRGADLRDATVIHIVLQHLLNLPTPIYHHHRLIRDADGKRLAKRDDAKSIARFRSEGASPQDIRAMTGLTVPEG